MLKRVSFVDSLMASVNGDQWFPTENSPGAGSDLLQGSPRKAGVATPQPLPATPARPATASEIVQSGS